MLAFEDDPGRSRPIIRIFGALEIVDGERVLGPRDLGGVRPKQLLEILLAARGHHVPVDRIAELIWDGQRPDDIAASIQTFVSVLRRRLVGDRARARQLVVTETEAYRFATDAVDLDLDRFDELLERSAREPTRIARQSLEQALSLVRGEVLEDEPYALWAQDLRGSYQGRELGARLDAADAALAELDFAASLAHAEAAVALDHFSERAQRSQMLTLYALGRIHEALDRYRNYRSDLDEELGLEPGVETRALEGAVIRQEDVRSLLPRVIEHARPVARDPPCPPGRTPHRARRTHGGHRARRRRERDADPDRRPHRRWQDAIARRTRARSSPAPVSDAQPARCSNGTCPTSRSRLRFGKHSPASISTLNGYRLSSRSCPSSR